MPVMSGLRLAHWRLRTQRLTGPRFAAPEQAVRWLGAVQSQEFGPALWSLGQRSGAVREADVERRFADGTFLRTHALRPTWHFVAREDIRWVLAATAHRVHALNAPYYRSLGLEEPVLARTGALVTAALRGGNQLTRPELRAVLAGAGFEAAGMRLAYLLMHAELTGQICSGARRGRQHTYALLAERAPGGREPGPDEALAELTRRYFTGHGPATAKDLRWWASLTLAEVARGLEMAGPGLRREEIDGVTYWYAEPGPPPEPPPESPPGPATPAVHLLQAYDEYVSYGNRVALDVSGQARIGTGDRAVFNHLIVLDSQVAGRWRRTVRRREVLVDAMLHPGWDDARLVALQEAADRHAAFLGVREAVVRTTPMG
jgi:hypothetical protein